MAIDFPGQAADGTAELCRLTLFEDLPFEDVASLVRSTHRRSVRRGTVLFLEGDPGDVTYICWRP